MTIAPMTTRERRREHGGVRRRRAANHAGPRAKERHRYADEPRGVQALRRRDAGHKRKRDRLGHLRKRYGEASEQLGEQLRAVALVRAQRVRAKRVLRARRA